MKRFANRYLTSPMCPLPCTPRPARALRGAALLITVVLAACAAVQPAPPEDVVRSRANARWQALVAGDFAAAYNYSTPGFKAVVATGAYKTRFGSAAWHGAEVISVACPEPTQCTARVRIDFKYLSKSKGADKISTHTDEIWLLENGQWWLFQTI